MITLFQQEQFGLANDPVTIGLYARSLAGKGAYERASAQMRTAYTMLEKQIQEKIASATILPRWYEDLYVVFGRRDGQLGRAVGDGTLRSGTFLLGPGWVGQVLVSSR